MRIRLFVLIAMLVASFLRPAYGAPNEEAIRRLADNGFREWANCPTILAGPKSMHISVVRRDESTKLLQSQLSLPVVDPATGKAIGAVTIGIDVSKLKR